MNSETPQDREANLNQSSELREIPEAEVTLETPDSKRSRFPDIWSDDDEIIDVQPDDEVIPEIPDNAPEAPEAPEAQEELDTWLEQQADNSTPEQIVEDTENEAGDFAPWLEEAIDNLDSKNAVAQRESDRAESPKNEELIADTWLDEADSATEEDVEIATENVSSSEDILSQAIAEAEDLTEIPSQELPSQLDSVEEQDSVESGLIIEKVETPEETIPELSEKASQEEIEPIAQIPIPETPEEPVEILNSISMDTSDANITDLEKRKAILRGEIATLQAQKSQILLQQAKDAQEMMGRLVEEGMKELKERKNVLQIEIEKLERRRERIDREMRNTFAGSSQELAVRIQGFKDYLVGSLQDLASAAEQVQLTRAEPPRPSREREPGRQRESRRERGRESRNRKDSGAPLNPQFTEQAFVAQTKRIRNLIDRYRTRPDYYGSPWQLRRTFESIHGKKIQEWFFSQGGRGAIDSLDSRLQNILVASAAISILRELYSDRCKILVLTDTPEKLGEWRRGLQDCLGISRSDFGSNRGVVLFDSSEVLVQRAERLVKDKQLPFIIIDETEELLNLSLLKFPLWLAFAGSPKSASSNYLY